MAALNKVLLIGNVGRKPELKNTNSGKAVCNFSLAINEKKDAEPLWMSVTCFEKLAENVVKYLDKGRPVYVEGRIQIRQYEKDGEKKTSVEVIANTVVFLGSGEKQDKPAAKPVDEDDGAEFFR